jgi:TolA-binding protein
MKKLLLFIPFLLLADINPFNITISSASYNALTPDEKQILANKIQISKINSKLTQLIQNIQSINLKLVQYDEQLSNISQKVDAFNTILSELDQARNDILNLKSENNLTKESIKKINDKINSLENNITQINNKLVALKNAITALNQLQNQNFIYLKNSIDTIIKSLKKNSKPLSAKEAFKKAKKLFVDGKLEEAKELFLYSLSKNYMPATSSFYLGEIAYKHNNCNEALGYYKKSVQLYPKKTSFTAKLLYHSAICFKKIGNKKAYKLTLEKLLNDFPSSFYAKLAKKELEK